MVKYFCYWWSPNIVKFSRGKKNNKGRYCAPNPFRTSCRPSGVSDPSSPSTSWFVVRADGLRVWANASRATHEWPHSASVHWQ